MKPSKGVNPPVLSAFSFCQAGVWGLGTDNRGWWPAQTLFPQINKEGVYQGWILRAWLAPHTLQSPAPDCIPFKGVISPSWVLNCTTVIIKLEWDRALITWEHSVPVCWAGGSASPLAQTHTHHHQGLHFPVPACSQGWGNTLGTAWKWKMDLPNSIMLFVCSGDTSALCQHHSPKHPRQSWKDPKTIPTSPGGREGSPALSCLQDPILLDSQQPWEHPEAFHTTLANVEINRKNKFLFSRFTFLGVKAAQSHKSGILMMFCVGWAALRAPEPLISTRREERESLCLPLLTEHFHRCFPSSNTPRVTSPLPECHQMQFVLSKLLCCLMRVISMLA